MRRCHRCGEDKPRDDFVPRGRNCGACRKLPPPSTIKRAKRACMWCHVVKAPEEFPWGDASGGKGKYRKRRGVCTECKTAHEKAKRERRAQAKVATWERAGVTYRRCNNCDTVYPLAEGFYANGRKPDGTVASYCYHCKACQIRRIGAYQSRLLRDPETAAATREKKRVQRQRWRAANYERFREIQKQYRERVKADPERHARQREAARMAHRLKRERDDGVPLEAIKLVTPRFRAREITGILPAMPLVEAVDAHLSVTDLTEDAILERTGVYPRQLWAWRSGEIANVQFAVAARVLTRLGLSWWEVFTDGPAHEAACQLFEDGKLGQAA